MEVDVSQHLPPAALPEELEESSIVDRTEVLESTLEPQPEFTVVDRGTIRGKTILVEAEGYSFTIKKQTATTTTWWCSIRNKRIRCLATVSQRSGQFNRGLHGHIHPADPWILVNVKIPRKVKDVAADNVFRSAQGVVEEQLQQTDAAAVDFPRPDQLVRKANRFRQNLRPDDPRGMDFELAENYIPGDFVREDLTVDGVRHLIFATSQQLDLLCKAKTWYVDATFKVMRSRDTFDQLFGIHAFLKKDEETKQVPLALVFMSRRRKKDYKKILKKIKQMFPEPPALQRFVLDFEAAIWKALRSVFPDATVQGCAFYWTQAVWKKAQSLGLSANYTGDLGTRKMIRRLLAMPLPAEHIPQAFQCQREKAANNDRMLELFNYVHGTWVEGSMWTRQTGQCKVSLLEPTTTAKGGIGVFI